MTNDSRRHLLEILGIDLPIVQAPMAGVSSPAMAAAVSNAGALGSLGVGATDAAGAHKMIAETRAETDRPFNVNVFCHQPAEADVRKEAVWIERLRPVFERFGKEPPASLAEIYTSFVEDDDMLATLAASRPKVVSFHFGLPSTERIQTLREAGIVLIGSATNLAEARALVDAGLDAIVAQGYEAGGHRGIFDPDATDEMLPMADLVRLIVNEFDIPVIAAGGIMDGGDIAAVLRLGAGAAQLGTAFVACDESLADADYRAHLASEAAHHTIITSVISGRPARCLGNAFTRFGVDVAGDDIPAYPITYDAGKALNAAAKAAGDPGFGAQWAGTAAPRARAMPAGALVAQLAAELERAQCPLTK